MRFEVTNDVAVITRPQVRNAVDRATAQALAAALDELDGRDDVRVGVLDGRDDVRVGVLTRRGDDNGA